MTREDFMDLPPEDRRHFYECQMCGQMVDKRQLDDVLFHEDHQQRPDMQGGEGKRLVFHTQTEATPCYWCW